MSFSTHMYTRIHTHTHMCIYVYTCVWLHMCMCNIYISSDLPLIKSHEHENFTVKEGALGIFFILLNIILFWFAYSV